MTKTVTVIRFGDARVRVLELRPDVPHHIIGGDGVVVFSRTMLADMTQKFTRSYGGNDHWVDGEIDVGSLRVKLTRWERLRAWLLRRPAVPRAVALPQHGLARKP